MSLPIQSTTAAVRLYNTITADKWCVARDDCAELVQLVHKSIASGEIIPSDIDRFDQKDKSIGPNFYTLNDQLIKPKTAAGGYYSWALMKHPEGLRCDLFVSHAWIEGTFEFLYKLLASWPRHSVHAWCCILAMPQNFDIANLISEPSLSPFAVALRSATYVLVVPNATTCVYNRLWCAYEAHLAYETQKIILTARNFSWTSRLMAVAVGLFSACCGFGFGLALMGHSHDFVNSWLFEVLIAVCMAAVAAPLFLSTVNSKLRCLLNNLAMVSFSFVCSCSFREDLKFFGSEFPEFYSSSGLFLVIVFLVATENDRISSIEIAEAKRQLAPTWNGSILHAGCSDPTDAQNIWKEIRDPAAVDQTVKVLLDTGISTPTLQQAASQGVHLRDVLDAPVAYHALVFSFVLLLGSEICYDAAHDLLSPVMLAHQVSEISLRLFFLFYVWHLQHEKRAFALVVITRCTIVCFSLWAVLIVGHRRGSISDHGMKIWWHIISESCIALASLVILPGINRLARSSVGKLALKLFIGRMSVRMPGIEGVRRPGIDGSKV